LKQKLFFKDAVEIFRGESAPEIRKTLLNSPFNPRPLKLLPHLLHPKSCKLKKTREQSQNIINLWFQLFSEILGDDRLSEKLWNTLYLILGDEGTPETNITTNLPEKNTQRYKEGRCELENNLGWKPS
jgi:hypothetical protein